MEAWKPGSLEAWKPGSLEAWKPGSLEILLDDCSVNLLAFNTAIDLSR